MLRKHTCYKLQKVLINPPSISEDKGSIVCNGKDLDLSSTIVMGILNVTPDSFYDGGRYLTKDRILNRAEEILSEGGTIIDVGGCSTRPGSNPVAEEEELRRVIPAIENISKQFPEAIISIDTWRSRIAAIACRSGAAMVNDISGGTIDSQMFTTVFRLGVPYVLMHIQGTPENMQKNPKYENVITEVYDFFNERIAILKNHGIRQIIIDPGFGFGKLPEHNYRLLHNLSHFKSLGCPILAGLSRKSMVTKIIGTTPDEALRGTTVLNTIALFNGATILRVHDVKVAMDAVKIVNHLTI